MTDIWDDPDIKVVSEYVKFEKVGDTVAGKITGVAIHRWDDGSACPKVMLINDATGEETSFTASQHNLKAALSEQRPAAGDHITVKFTGEVQAKKGKAKLFDVTVVRGSDTWAVQQSAATPAPAAPVAAPAPAPAADPLAGLTPEQIAAVAALQAQQAK